MARLSLFLAILSPSSFAAPPGGGSNLAELRTRLFDHLRAGRVEAAAYYVEAALATDEGSNDAELRMVAVHLAMRQCDVDAARQHCAVGLEASPHDSALGERLARMCTDLAMLYGVIEVVVGHAAEPSQVDLVAGDPQLEAVTAEAPAACLDRSRATLSRLAEEVESSWDGDPRIGRLVLPVGRYTLGGAELDVSHRSLSTPTAAGLPPEKHRHAMWIAPRDSATWYWVGGGAAAVVVVASLVVFAAGDEPEKQILRGTLGP